MKDPEKTIGGMIDKAGTCFISYVDEDGFPVTKAMLPPRERNGIKELVFHEHIIQQSEVVQEKQ